MKIFHKFEKEIICPDWDLLPVWEGEMKKLIY
jgi:hypothetical protein